MEAMYCGMLIGGPLHVCVEADDSSHSDTKGKVTDKSESTYEEWDDDDGDDDIDVDDDDDDDSGINGGDVDGKGGGGGE